MSQKGFLHIFFLILSIYVFWCFSIFLLAFVAEVFMALFLVQNLTFFAHSWHIFSVCLHLPQYSCHSDGMAQDHTSWLYICLHDTQCHAGASHSGVSSPRLLYQGENFTPVRNFVTVSCKHETTTHFGVKSVCRWTGTGSACAIFAIFNRTGILSTWSVPSNNRDMKWPITGAIQNQKVTPIWNWRRCEFSHVYSKPPHPPFVVSAGINALMKSTRLQNFQRHHGKRVRFTSEASIDWDRKGAIYTAKTTNFAFWMQLEKHPLWQTCEDKHWQSNCQDIQWDRHFHSVRYW